MSRILQELLNDARDGEAFDKRVRGMYSDMKRRARGGKVFTGGLWIQFTQALPFTVLQLAEWMISRRVNPEHGAMWRCEYCRMFLLIGEVQLDHATPVSRGGSYALENLVCACKRCNQTKGELTQEEYTALLLKLDELEAFPQTYVLKCLRMIGLGARLQRGRDVPADAGEGGIHEERSTRGRRSVRRR